MLVVLPQAEDERVDGMITGLLRQHLEVLTSDKSTEDSKPWLLNACISCCCTDDRLSFIDLQFNVSMMLRSLFCSWPNSVEPLTQK